MQDLINQVAAIAELRKEATPGPWVQWAEHADVYAATSDLENEPHQLSGVRVKIAECEIDERFDLMGTDEENENDGPYDGEANAAFITAVGNLDFEAVAAALATTPAPLADAELVFLQQLEEGASPAPWTCVVKGNTVKSHAIPGVCSGISPKTGNASFIAAMRNALPGLLARLAAAEAHSATLQGALESSTDTNRVLAVRLKAIADALPGIAKHLTDAVAEADAESEGQGDGYEACYNEADNAAAALRKLLGEINPTVKGGQPHA